MNRDLFEHPVAEALDTLPQFFREKLDNVEVVVEDWPEPETMQQAGVRHPTELLGFYRGVPQTKRTSHYGLVLPDKITIYQGPIEACCRTAEEIRRKVRRVVLHELGHHFGISDERLRELGVY